MGCRVQLVVAFRHARKADELGPVARAGDDKRAVGHHAGIGVAPQGDRLQAEVAHHGLRRLRLAVGREHGAGIGAGGVRKRLGRALDEPHAVAPAGERQRLPQAGDAGADHGDGERLHGR